MISQWDDAYRRHVITEQYWGWGVEAAKAKGQPRAGRCRRELESAGLSPPYASSLCSAHHAILMCIPSPAPWPRPPSPLTGTRAMLSPSTLSQLFSHHFLYLSCTLLLQHSFHDLFLPILFSKDLCRVDHGTLLLCMFCNLGLRAHLYPWVEVMSLQSRFYLLLPGIPGLLPATDCFVNWFLSLGNSQTTKKI